jgi:hypothetical protein
MPAQTSTGAAISTNLPTSRTEPDLAADRTFHHWNELADSLYISSRRDNQVLRRISAILVPAFNVTNYLRGGRVASRIWSFSACPRPEPAAGKFSL